MRLVGLPNFRLTSCGISITGNTRGSARTPFHRLDQTSFNYQGRLSWIRSSHVIKMGAKSAAPAQLKNTSNYIPSFSFSTLLDFIYDDPLQETRKVDPRTGLPPSMKSLRATSGAVHHDDWKVRRISLINFGLRYENYGSPTEINGQLRNLVLGRRHIFRQPGRRQGGNRSAVLSHRSHNIAPRVGFAWNPDKEARMSIRGGYGIAYDRIFQRRFWIRDKPPMRADATSAASLATQALYTLGDPNKA